MILSILAGFFLTRPAKAQAPTTVGEEVKIIQQPVVVEPIPVKKTPAARPALASYTVANYTGTQYSKEEVIELIKHYAQEYNISADLPLRVARCESGYNQFSKNRNSSASGVFQYIASTWRNTEAGRQGLSPFDADANVKMAIKSIASGGISNWNASRGCWK